MNGVGIIEPWVIKRATKDAHRKNNNQCKKLLDFCSKQDLDILNGRTRNDEGVPFYLFFGF